MFLEQARSLDQPRELGHRVRLNFCGDRGAVELYHPLADAQMAGNLLVQSSLYHLLQHFAFAWRQGIETAAQFLQSGYLAIVPRACPRFLNEIA